MLLTRAEATHYRETSLHADVMAFVAALDARRDPRLWVGSFGRSPQGRELPLLVLSTGGVSTPAQAKALGRPVVLMLDGIHPGEVEGKEATLALIRDLLDGRAPELADALHHLTLVVVPLFNPDGNDALDPANRRLELKKLHGQIGPVVGTRTQSHGINLNRDWMRLQAPESRLLQAGVIGPWQPDLTIDNHATNGSVHRMQMTVDVPHTVAAGRPEPIELVRTSLVPDVIRAVRRRGFESGWYGNFVEDERALDAGVDVDGTATVGEGWMTYPHHPRFGANQRGLTGRMDLLLECYSYLPFEERVHTASAWQIETLAWVARHPDLCLQTVADASTPRDRIAVRSELGVFDTLVEIPTRNPRTLDGLPVTVKLPHLARFVGSTVVDRPAAYVVPPEVAAHLRLHGLEVGPAPAEAVVRVATIEGLGTAAGRKILEAGSVGDVSVSWREERRAVPAGWASVSTDQRLGAVAVYLCEPESDDGAAENGLVAVPELGAEHPIWRVERV
ncbi:MAG: peptidase [Alphaproteobacteria bacterium]|nr:peptidase [Alphaproteobacteria bacterium]MCB9700058.1 peptidase [Alphaproteobacteria bacterium]